MPRKQYDTPRRKRVVKTRLTEKEYADFAGEPEASFVTGKALAKLGEPCSFTELLNKLGTKIEECIAEDASI